MAGQATQSPSRIPLPVKNSPTAAQIPVTGIYMQDLVDGENEPSLQQPSVSYGKENGNIKAENQDLVHSSQAQKGKGFDTFLMTGEMIIHTNPSVTQKLVKPESEVKALKESHIPRPGQSDPKHQQHPKPQQQQQQHPSIALSPKLQSKIPGPVKNHNPPQQHVPSSHHSHSPPPQDANHHQQAVTVHAKEFPLVHAPVAEMEELSDLSQSSCSESELGLENDSVAMSPSLPANSQPLPPSTTDSSRLEQAMENLEKLLQPSVPGNNNAGLPDTLFPEPPSSGDSGFVHDGHISDPDLAGRGLISHGNTLSKESFLSDETLTGTEEALLTDNTNSNMRPSLTGQTETGETMIASSSGEKFSIHSGNTERLLVRTSKSHENYLQAGTGIALVSIDIEDNLAYSLDTLTYHDSPDSSMDSVASEPMQMSRSLDNSPEKKSEKSSSIEREFIPGFISLDDTKPAKLKLNKQKDDTENGRHDEFNNSGNFMDVTYASSPSHRFQNRDNRDGKFNNDSLLGQTLDISGGDSVHLGEDLDTDSLYHQPSKAVDKPSAERLAKRLFNLEGFRKSDVSRHLCKK